jgi:hypothetical protein
VFAFIRLDTIARQTIGALVARPITKEELLGMPAPDISEYIDENMLTISDLIEPDGDDGTKSMTLMLIFLVFWVVMTDHYMMGSADICVGDTVEYSAER